MNGHPHKNEIVRWAYSPKGTKVWSQNSEGGWYLLSKPDWNEDVIYIVDDRHAEIRKKWIDMGKPKIQYFNEYSGSFKDCIGEPTWDLNREYRIKPNEWDTPEGVDPIAYHAERIDPGWELDWNDTDQIKYLIAYSHADKKYYYAPYSSCQYINAIYMSEKSAEAIVDALNIGELKIEKENK